jgi:hypothetical protein
MRRKGDSEMSNTVSEYDYFKNENGHKDTIVEKTRKKWIRCKEATVRYGVSRPTIMHWAEDSGALFRIDATILIDSETMDDYIESFRIPGGVY